MEDDWVIPEEPETTVAAIAEEASYLSRGMIVVNVEHDVPTILGGSSADVTSPALL